MKRIFTKENFDSLAKVGLGTALLLFVASLLIGSSVGESLAKLAVGIVIAGIFYGIAGELKE